MLHDLYVTVPAELKVTCQALTPPVLGRLMLPVSAEARLMSSSEVWKALNCTGFLTTVLIPGVVVESYAAAGETMLFPDPPPQLLSDR